MQNRSYNRSPISTIRAQSVKINKIKRLAFHAVLLGRNM